MCYRCLPIQVSPTMLLQQVNRHKHWKHYTVHWKKIRTTHTKTETLFKTSNCTILTMYAHQLLQWMRPTPEMHTLRMWRKLLHINEGSIQNHPSHNNPSLTLAVRCFRLVSVSVSVQNGMEALGKAHTHSAPPLSRQCSQRLCMTVCQSGQPIQTAPFAAGSMGLWEWWHV